MATNEIRINVVQEQMEQAAAARGGGSGQGSAPESENKRNQSELPKYINLLTKEIKYLNDHIKSLTNEIKRGGLGGGGGAGGGAGGSGMKFGMGAFAGGGMLGLPLAAATWAMRHVMDIGRSRIEYMSQQKGTAGLGGVTSGRYSYLSGSEYSAARKEYQLASGKFSDLDEMETFARKTEGKAEKWETKGQAAFRARRNIPDIFKKYSAGYGSPFNKETGDIQWWRIQSKMFRESAQKEYQESVSPRKISDAVKSKTYGVELGTESEKYMKTFGVQGQRLFGMAGTLSAMGPQGGGFNQMEKIVNIVRGAGVTGQMQYIIEGIGDKMKQAVEEGVNNSNLATDMATEISGLSAFSLTGTSYAAKRIVDSQQNVQTAVGKGKWGGGLVSSRMMRAGQNVILKDLQQYREKNVISDELNTLMEQGFIDKAVLGKYKETGKVDTNVLMAGSQMLNFGKNTRVKDLAIDELIGTLKGGETGATGQSSMLLKLQHYAGELGDNPEDFRILYQGYLKRKGFKGEPSDYSDNINTTIKKYNENSEKNFSDLGAKRGGKAFVSQNLENQRNALLFNEAAKSAANTVVTIERGMRTLADSLSGPVSKSIDKFTSAATWLADKVSDVGKEKENEAKED